MNSRPGCVYRGAFTLLDYSRLSGVEHRSLLVSFARFSARFPDAANGSRVIKQKRVHGGASVKTVELTPVVGMAFFYFRKLCGRAPAAFLGLPVYEGTKEGGE